MTYSCRVFELAVPMMHMMVESKLIDPLEAGGHVIAGFLAERELNDLEWEVLKECVAMR